MKFFLGLPFLVLVASNAFASPSVGDEILLADQSGKNSIHVKLIGYDKASDSFHSLRDITIDGVTERNDEMVPSDLILNDRRIQEIVDGCHADGTSERVTVPSGTFEACRGVFYPGDAIGLVPFGYLIRPFSHGSDDIDVELVSFTRGESKSGSQWPKHQAK